MTRFGNLDTHHAVRIILKSGIPHNQSIHLANDNIAQIVHFFFDKNVVKGEEPRAQL